MKNLVSIFAGHDANITFYNAAKDEYHLIELERLVKKRYFRLHVDNSPDYQKEILTLCQEIAEEDWGIENDYEAVLISSDGFIQVDPNQIFNTEKVVTVAKHHQTHETTYSYRLPTLRYLLLVLHRLHCFSIGGAHQCTSYYLTFYSNQKSKFHAICH